ncbi:hypothetical protein PVK06_030212 [Gossypium arboreum]|uniref:Uncharacterized protein n=1 Tax=Gossypium arboreum TaxID=29729 RepID=A0ABR0NMW0_GOSAR|nr:hypothetical protein PVK06_030212 [Gossypium arboreum]
MVIIPSSAYIHSSLWCISAPVINFQTVEWYHGDRVLWQFGCIQYILTLLVRLGEIHGINRRGKHGNDWGEVHEEYITIWNNQLGRAPQMDCALDLQPSLQYIQWYCEIGKPFLFGGQLMVVLPHTTRIGQPLPDLHHAPEPERHSGDSSYHPDLGGDDYFQGLLGHRYHSEFDIVSPLPHQYFSHPGFYPPQYSTHFYLYPPPYSTSPDLYPLPYSTPLDLYPPLYSIPPGPYPLLYSTPPGSSSSMAFETYDFSSMFRIPPHIDKENVDRCNHSQRERRAPQKICP